MFLIYCRHQTPVALDPDWVSSSFSDIKKPFIIDVGCAKGSWALHYAAANPDHNVLGLEIRGPMVDLAIERAKESKLSNIRYLACNANVDMYRILEDLTKLSSEIRLVAMQFPDPCFKKKHKKRRLINTLFLNTIAGFLKENSEIFFQSDVDDLSISTVELIESSSYFSPCDGYLSASMLTNPNPTGIPTEREISVLKRNLNVYRMLFRRNSNLIPIIK